MVDDDHPRQHIEECIDTTVDHFRVPLFVAEFVRIQAFVATHLKSHDFSYGAKARLNRDCEVAHDAVQPTSRIMHLASCRCVFEDYDFFFVDFFAAFFGAAASATG